MHIQKNGFFFFCQVLKHTDLMQIQVLYLITILSPTYSSKTLNYSFSSQFRQNNVRHFKTCITFMFCALIDPILWGFFSSLFLFSRLSWYYISLYSTCFCFSSEFYLLLLLSCFLQVSFQFLIVNKEGEIQFLKQIILHHPAERTLQSFPTCWWLLSDLRCQNTPCNLFSMQLFGAQTTQIVQKLKLNPSALLLVLQRCCSQLSLLLSVCETCSCLENTQPTANFDPQTDNRTPTSQMGIAGFERGEWEGMNQKGLA